jgi:DNA-binding CsgD family transcriptional regulator
MNEVIDFVLNKIPTGVIVIDSKLEIIYRNRRAANFLERFELPDEITNISKRIFNALRISEMQRQFPGEIHLQKKIDGSPSNWTFRFSICDNADPFISIFILEETISNKLDMNKIREKFRLTRRETDVLKHTIDGYRNIEIARDLDIAEQTVKDHLSNVYMKLGAENRLALMQMLMHSSALENRP